MITDLATKLLFLSSFTFGVFAVEGSGDFTEPVLVEDPTVVEACGWKAHVTGPISTENEVGRRRLLASYTASPTRTFSFTPLCYISLLFPAAA